MKKQYLNLLLIAIIGLVTLIGCDNDDRVKVNPLTNGYYSGTFTYDSLTLWESFSIENGNFSELASGGVWFQKFPVYCLTEGSYKIIDDKIYFENIQVVQPPNKDVNVCNEEYLLMGSYFVENYSDTSIVFWRTINEKKQTYDLKFYYGDD